MPNLFLIFFVNFAKFSTNFTMTLGKYLISRNIYRPTGFTKEEKVIREHFGVTSRKIEIDEVALDSFLSQYYAVIPKGLSNFWNYWVKHNISILNANKPRKEPQHVNDFPNYDFYEAVLPLTRALERDIHKDGIINVFKDPNFVPKRNWSLSRFLKFISPLNNKERLK